MSQTQILSESTSQLRHKATAQTQTNSNRFTPLRSAVIARKRAGETGADRLLSRLVPDRRLQS